MKLDLRPSHSLGLAQYTALFNAAYEGYLITFHLDESTAAAMAEAFDLDADASRIALRDGETVGLGNLGIRGEDAWIGGVGVVPAARRSGRESVAREASAAEAHQRVRELRSGREPWQRADETLAHYGDGCGLVTDDGAAVYRQPGENVQLIQIAGNADSLLHALRTLGPVSVLNLPENDRSAPAFRSLGATVVVRQHEMLLELEEH